ncbi:uncharacterized protein THITE_2114879 [Thermothielavioides terrestris NRRL 8126]|uniref:Uncharacterized protein n=1 Tax=Thermothielavioides terrestris (strain ATCC 38088 / NRRL 8126) TaxID=578455 RepID=G2R267_THETT|nr:uncharacterized protein THITE_2114879 [Thermothielavioides terrestris NRRL 8126]AEO66651.1 hypothetical protein THITE_2114879 [Thermothielavioides terrestris NRRL 8126]
MHLGRTASLYAAVSLFATACPCLPFNEHRPAPSQVLAPRATYSVVPIDGGSGPGGSNSGSGSGSDSGTSPIGAVTVTVVQTLAPVTDHVTDTVVVTKTVQIVNIGPDTTTRTADAAGTSTSQPSAASTTPPQTTQTLATISSPSNSTRPIVSCQPTTSPASIPVPLATGYSSSSSKTYDNGAWHTSYPAWNQTLPRRASRNWLRPRRAV